MGNIEEHGDRMHVAAAWQKAARCETKYVDPEEQAINKYMRMLSAGRADILPTDVSLSCHRLSAWHLPRLDQSLQR